MGMGGNGNLKSHSRTSLIYTRSTLFWSLSVTHTWQVFNDYKLISPPASRCRRAYNLKLYRCVFSFFLSFFFFRRLISDVTERMITKLGHAFTYDCYLNNFVLSPTGVYHPRAWGKNRFLGPTSNFDHQCDKLMTETVTSLPYLPSI